MYDKLGPTGGYRRLLKESVEAYEQKLIEQGEPTYREHLATIAERMAKK
jgi:hypothetical protein